MHGSVLQEVSPVDADEWVDAVVGVPVHPRHASQFAALGGSLCFDLGGLVALDADDVRCRHAEVIAEV